AAAALPKPPVKRANQIARATGAARRGHFARSHPASLGQTLSPIPPPPFRARTPRPPRRHTSTKLSTRPGEVPFPTFDQKLAALNREATSRARRESRRRPGARGGGS